MIVKSFSRSNTSFGQLLAYIDREADNEQGYIRHLLGRDKAEIEQEFLRNAEYIKESRGKNFLYHTVLSFSRDSQPFLSDEILFDLSAQFLDLYNPDAMAYANIHKSEDKQPHVHIMHSANGLGERKRHIHSKETYRQIKLLLQEYQKVHYPFLEQSLVIHGKGKTKKSKDSIRRIQGRGQTPDLQHLQNKIDKAFHSAQSKTDFLSRIRASGLELYKYRERFNGIRYKGRKYRFARLGVHKEKMLELHQRERYLQRTKELRKNPHKGRDFDKRR